MEHLDSLAGSISYKHMLGPGVETLGRIQERGFYIVTASVDRLHSFPRWATRYTVLTRRDATGSTC